MTETFFSSREECFWAVTSVTVFGSIDNQSITKIVFCNIALKIEQMGRFSNRAVNCYKMLRLVTRRKDCKCLNIFMLHLLQMLQGKYARFLNQLFFDL
jgi:hypothetical protein